MEKIEVSPSEITVKEQESFTLEYSVYPENATDKELIFSSSDANIATVTDKGKVTALKPGKCIINVSTKDEKITGTCELTVIEAPIEELIKVGLYGSSTSINGFVTGNVSAVFYNNSSRTVYVRSLKMYNTLTNKVVFEKEDLGEAVFKHPVEVGIQFYRVYKPLFVWEYECDGKVYQIEYRKE